MATITTPSTKINLPTVQIKNASPTPIVHGELVLPIGSWERFTVIPIFANTHGFKWGN